MMAVKPAKSCAARCATEIAQGWPKSWAKLRSADKDYQSNHGAKPRNSGLP
jgi:hypothetical protein